MASYATVVESESELISRWTSCRRCIATPKSLAASDDSRIYGNGAGDRTGCGSDA